MTQRKKGQTEIIIFPDWCKGCGICVAFCPADVLAMDENGKACVANGKECINCGFCERHCPDFAIMVKPRNRKKSLADELTTGNGATWLT